MIRIIASFIFIICFFSCANKKEDINKLFDKNLDMAEEVAYNGYLYYSDSARLKVKLHYDELQKIKVNNEELMEFPKGIHVEFYNASEKPISWLTSKYAIRNERKATLVVKDSVVLYNKDNDKLVTSELIWKEKEELITTEKYVRITQPIRGDTSFGYGFRAKQDFSEFEIGKFSGKGTIDGIK